MPYAYRGSKWKGLIKLDVSRSFSIGIIVDGETARVTFRLDGLLAQEPFLVLEAGREVRPAAPAARPQPASHLHPPATRTRPPPCVLLAPPGASPRPHPARPTSRGAQIIMSMLDGSATPCMLVVSGALWVSNWEHALLFQEAFDLNPGAYARWREEQRHVLVRQPHSPRRELAGGADVHEDVEAALQQVLAERAREREVSVSEPGVVGSIVGSLLCCSARGKGFTPPPTPTRKGGGLMWRRDESPD